MCGITGVINFDGSPTDQRILKRMTDAISHRGPDGEGWYQDNGVGLGHRRLAIIDLSSAGKQPMVTPDGRFALTYNGEIYNFKEIRIELERLGHKFRSNTDSEVVLYAWAEWGRNCVIKFNGMFAFAVWDSLERTLYLVRDRYGIKPVYYAKFGKHFLFGSEQRAIRAFPAFTSSMDEEALLEYLTFQNIFTDKTLTRDLRLLPPGQIMTVAVSGVTSTFQYWDFHFAEPTKEVDELEYQEELQRLLAHAVKRQSVSDVEIGAYLSGGVDSGTIIAISSKSLPSIKTFTCGFDLSSAVGAELDFDERVRAEAISALFKTEHFEIVLNSFDMERCLDQVVRQIEEPRVGQSYPNYLIARLASKFVKVIFSGTGGDELFGGYPWRYYRADESLDFESFIDGYYNYWHRLVSNNQLKRLLTPINKKVSHVWTRDIFRNVFLDHKNKLDNYEDYINHCLYFEAKTFLHGLLVVEDKLNMAHGLETRVPLLDNQLVDFAMRCPVGLKVKQMKTSFRVNENDYGNKRNNYFYEMGQGKSILRNVMEKYVPIDIARGQKKGFSSPDSTWFSEDSRDFVNCRLRNKESRVFEYLNFGETQELIDEHQSGRVNRRLLIWSLLSIDSLLTQSN